MRMAIPGSGDVYARPHRSLYFSTIAVLLVFAIPAMGESCHPAKPHPPTAAEDAYSHGRFSDAEASYRQALSTAPNDTALLAGLARSLRRQQKIAEAATDLQLALTDAPQSAILLTAMAELQYREGMIVESGESASAAYAADICYARVHLIRARLASLNSKYATERIEITAAHTLDPYDPDIQLAWIETLPLDQRIAELKTFLSSPTASDDEQRQDLEKYIDRLEKISAGPRNSCRLVSDVASTKLLLESVLGEQLRPRSWALMAKVNGADAKLEVDSGSTGFYISSKIARKAGLQALERSQVSGLGDRGPQEGYIAYAKTIRIGNLEFRDCLVDVSDSKRIGLSDGLIGTDIFQNFLVTLAFPLRTMELSPLPSRPGEAASAASLQTQTQTQVPAVDDSSPPAGSNGSKTGNFAAKQMAPGPKDRYIAPEMQDWFPVFRVNHNLIVPALTDANAMKLFILDTGSEVTVLSEDAAKEIHRIYESPERRIVGLSGEVQHVYSGATFNIRFANQNVKTREAAVLDTSRFSNNLGVEISGLIGLPALRLMTMRIDYRDGLVKFDYDPTIVPDDR
jgi:hypothetical protein